ncbi:MAG: Kdo hydroxylase family protein [Ramlibacter sp.]
MDGAIVELDVADWRDPGSHREWIDAVEHGKVLYFPRLAFELEAAERMLLRPEILAGRSRNISMDAMGAVRGLADMGALADVQGLLGRFAQQARSLVDGLFPAYSVHLLTAPTSLRTQSVSQRRQSVRADDRRLHVDAFPSRPNRGERILRVFANINPQGEPRVWRVGEPFDDVARRFLPRVRPYSPHQARLLQLARVTKSLRSEYDHLMLQLHDTMKADEAYQREGPQARMDFPPGSCWVCFSDQTVHAAMSGQHMVEQTFHLPAGCQYNQDSSPIAILTGLAGHSLI